MPRLTSAIDPTSDDFKSNEAAMTAVIRDLRAVTAAARLGGPEASRDRHVARGKLLVRDRIDTLLDPGSPFLELSPLAAHNMYDGEISAAGIVTGIGRIEGRECMIVANDATVKGGTYFPLTVKKHLRAQEIARAKICPASIWWIRAARTCPTRTRCFPTAIISGAFFSIRRRCRPRACPRSRR